MWSCCAATAPVALMPWAKGGTTVGGWLRWAAVAAATTAVVAAMPLFLIAPRSVMTAPDTTTTHEYPWGADHSGGTSPTRPSDSCASKNGSVDGGSGSGTGHRGRLPGGSAQFLGRLPSARNARPRPSSVTHRPSSDTRHPGSSPVQPGPTQHPPAVRYAEGRPDNVASSAAPINAPLHKLDGPSLTAPVHARVVRSSTASLHELVEPSPTGLPNPAAVQRLQSRVVEASPATLGRIERRVLDAWQDLAIVGRALATLGARCAHLRHLGLARTATSDYDLRAIAHGCPQLETITLAGCRPGVTDDGLEALAEGCPGLRRVDLAGCRRVGDRGVAALARGCVRLQAVDVTGCRNVGNASIIALAEGTWSSGSAEGDLSQGEGHPSHVMVGNGPSGAQHNSWHRMEVGRRSPHAEQSSSLSAHNSSPLVESRQSFSQSSSEYVPSRSLMENRSSHAIAETGSSLVELKVAGCGRVTDASLASLAACCPWLASLDISGALDVTDEGIMALAHGACAGTLAQLRVAGCFLTDAGLSALIERSPRLFALDLAACDGVTDASVALLARGCPLLEYFSVGGCRDVTDASLRTVAAGCPRLRCVNLAWCRGVTDVTMVALAAGCPDLDYLIVKGCGGVTDVGIRAVAGGCPRLQHLVAVGYSANVTMETIRLLVENCRDLEELEITANNVGVSYESVRQVLPATCDLVCAGGPTSDAFL
eukprot:jgi/Mesvir1/9219/Mv22983-RA.3